MYSVHFSFMCQVISYQYLCNVYQLKWLNQKIRINNNHLDPSSRSLENITAFSGGISHPARLELSGYVLSVKAMSMGPLFLFLFVLISLNGPHQQLSMCSFCDKGMHHTALERTCHYQPSLMWTNIWYLWRFSSSQKALSIHSNSSIYLSLQMPMFDHNMWSHWILAMPLSSWISLYINVVCGNVTEVFAHAQSNT